MVIRLDGKATVSRALARPVGRFGSVHNAADEAQTISAPPTTLGLGATTAVDVRDLFEQKDLGTADCPSLMQRKCRSTNAPPKWCFCLASGLAGTVVNCITALGKAVQTTTPSFKGPHFGSAASSASIRVAQVWLRYMVTWLLVVQVSR